jgi:hypothetical protein
MARALNRVAFGDERTVPASASMLDRQTIPATRRRMGWTIAGAAVLIVIFGYFAWSGQMPFLMPASTPTSSLTPVPTSVPPSETLPPPTATPAPASTPNVTPESTVPGGSDQIAILADSQLYFMNTDGSNLIQIRTDNAAKYNLQWIPGNRLVYISRNCAFMVDGDTKENEQIVCFNSAEALEGFRVSPDGSLVAISIQRTLNIIAFDIPALNQMDTRFNFIGSSRYCFYSQFPFRDVLWGWNQDRVAARVVDTELINSDQIFLLSVDLPNCGNVGPTRIDKFPGVNFGFTHPDSSRKITSFDWDGDRRFLLNDSVRNDGFGDLYLYDSETLQERIINPIDGLCCYRDARWSPDGKYILFLFQRYDSSDVTLYYVPFADVEAGRPLAPLELPPGFLSPRDKPQPALRPIP